MERIVALSEATGDRVQLARAIAVLAWTLDEDLTPVDEALARVDVLREHTRGDRPTAAALDISAAYHHALAGRVEEGRQLAEASFRGLEELGARLPVITFMSLRTAMIDVLAGDLETAEARLRGSYLELERMGNTGFLSSRAAYLAVVLEMMGRDDEALEFAAIAERTAARDDLEPQVWLREGRAKVLSKRGEHAEAVRAAKKAVDIISATEWALRHADALVTLGEVLEAAGQGPQAVEAFTHAAEMYHQKGATLPEGRVHARLDSIRNGLGDGR
jgi:tetratricopeptide (TPR) repeat protein